MLFLDRVYYQYHNRLVLDGIDLTLAPGKILCITGPSGCGKTTLLRIAAGLIVPNSGLANNTFANTACVFQEPRLLPWQTTQENLAFGLKAQGIPQKKRDRYSQDLARQLGLEQALNYYPHQLSGGMQQRVALGRALAVNPDLLLLDEPFNGLDIGKRQEFQAMLLTLLSDRHLAACIVSHDLTEAVRLGDRILVMSPSPSRIVYQWQSDRSPAARDEIYVYQEVARLLAIPQVSKCFRLNNFVFDPDFMKSNQ